MRALTFLLPAAVLALSACASTGEPVGGYGEQVRALADDCKERGGILVPRQGQQTGRPQADHFCQIAGGASRLDRD